jgi:hypothetical protein
MLIRQRLVRSPDGPAGGGAPPADPAAPPVTTPPATTPPAGGLLAEIGDDPAPPAKDANGKPVRPDFIGEQFWDAEKGEVRLADLAKSQRDLRAQISRGEHKPPEKPEAYAVPKVEGVPEGLIGGEGDKLWPEIRAAAHAAGMTQKMLDAVAAPLLKAIAETAPEAQDPAVRKQQVEAEFAKLGPNGRQVARDVKAWIAGMHARGELTEAERDAAYGIGTAEGIRLFAKLRALSGEKAIPTDAFADEGAMALADANRLMQEGYREGGAAGEAKVAKAMKALEQMEREGRLPAA